MASNSPYGVREFLSDCVVAGFATLLAATLLEVLLPGSVGAYVNVVVAWMVFAVGVVAVSWPHAHGQRLPVSMASLVALLLGGIIVAVTPAPVALRMSLGAVVSFIFLLLSITFNRYD